MAKSSVKPSTTASKNDSGNNKSASKEKKKGGIGKAIGMFFAFLLAVLIIFVLLLKFDVASLGTKVIGPLIQNIPGASLILPTMPEDTTTTTSDTGQTYETIDQVVEILKVTENTLKEKEQEAEKLLEEIQTLQTENERLKTFEDNYLAFQADKEAFDQLIATSSTPADFTEWYAKMNPDNAAKIYGEMIVEVKKNEELDNLVATYQAMKAANAAAVLENMATTRLEMVANIIAHLDAEQAGKILGAMDPVVASRITAYLYPTN